MAARVINLRAARKSAVRDAARKQGAENAVKFGMTKPQKAASLQHRLHAARHLDGHHLDRETGGDQGHGD